MSDKNQALEQRLEEPISRRKLRFTEGHTTPEDEKLLRELARAIEGGSIESYRTNSLHILGTGLVGLAAVVSMESCATLQGPEIVYPRNAPKILSDYQEFRGVAGGTRPQPHSGIDIQGRLGDTYGSIGEPVLAAADGVVIMSYWRPGGGNTVIIDHGRDIDGNFLATMYLHNSENLVSAGQQVRRGQQIANVGQTGAAVGGAPHVHFQLYRGAKKFAAPENFNINDFHHNPHEYWVDGLYKVTCFDAKRNYSTYPIRFTYPVKCK